jgi:hypothetical protein
LSTSSSDDLVKMSVREIGRGRRDVTNERDRYISSIGSCSVDTGRGCPEGHAKKQATTVRILLRD